MHRARFVCRASSNLASRPCRTARITAPPFKKRTTRPRIVFWHAARSCVFDAQREFILAHRRLCGARCGVARRKAQHIPRRLLSTNSSCTRRLSARDSKVTNRDYAKSCTVVAKFYAAEYCKHSLAKHTVNVLRYETCRHKTPHAKQLCRAVHDLSAFGV